MSSCFRQAAAPARRNSVDGSPFARPASFKGVIAIMSTPRATIFLIEPGFADPNRACLTTPFNEPHPLARQRAALNGAAS